MNRLRASTRRLATVERLRDLELEQARLEKSKADSMVEQHSRAVDDLERQLEQTRSVTQSRVTSTQGVSVGLMRQFTEYANWQVRSLEKCQRELQRSEDLAEQARAELVHRLEQLSVIERLRERRLRELSMEDARREQKILDDQGTIAAGHREVRACNDDRSEQGDTRRN